MFAVSRDRPEMDANLINFNWIIFIYKNRRGGEGGYRENCPSCGKAFFRVKGHRM